MGNFCGDSNHNSYNDLNNKNNIIRNNSMLQSGVSPTIQENVSIYSNDEDNNHNNNDKYFNNETDLNNLRSSIFDNDENDHVKKYEQEINTYEHPYLFNSGNNNNINPSNYNEYTFKNNSPSGGNFTSLKSSTNRISNFNKSNEFILNNKNSFQRFNILKNKKEQKYDETCSFGNINNVQFETNNNINKRDNNNYISSDIENIENENIDDLMINEFINKNEAKRQINNFDPKVMNKFAMNQLIKIQKKVRKSIQENNPKFRKYKKANINDELLLSLNIINSSTNKTITNNEKNFCLRYYNNGAIYIGQIKDNKCNGYGKYRTQNDDLIMGIFNNNCLHEYGIIERRKINSIYEGELQNNIFKGIGIELFKDGATYYGEFYNNSKHGIGTYIWNDDSQYQGQWKNGEMNGYGIFFDSKGRNYEGQWKEGNMDGIGTFKWDDGRKYIGFFKNDKRDGFGIYLWKNPLKIYSGFWKNGEQNGYGKVYTPYKEKSYFWNKGKRNKSFNNNDNMIKEIIKGNTSSITSKIEIFKMSFDDILSFMLDV